MTNILLIVVLSGNLKVWSDSPFNFLSTHNALQHCNVFRYSIKMQNLAKVQNGRLAPSIRQDAHADGAKRRFIACGLVNTVDLILPSLNVR